MRAVLVWLCAVAALLGVAYGQTTEEALFTVAILHMNDHHSFLEEGKFDIPVANVPDLVVPPETEEVSVFYGGFPRLKSVFAQAEATYNDTLVKLHAGDALVGTVLFTLFRGDADAELMKLLCFDAFALGNHEFDDGDTQLAEFITELKANAEICDTKVLSANLVPHDASPLKMLQESGDLLSSTILSVRGEDVGIVGINIRNKTLFSSSPDVGTDYLDEVETAKVQVSALTEAGVNKIILLTHIGYENDIDWMVEIPGVDAIVGGDSHTLLGDEAKLPYVGTPVGPYPSMMKASDGRNVCVLQAWEYAHLVGLAELAFNSDGDLIECGGTPVVAFDPVRFDPGLDDPFPLVQHLESFEPFFSFPENEEVKMALDTFSAEIQGSLETKICDVDGDICFERIPGQGRSLICPMEASAEQGGGVCNLVAQAFLDQTPTADFAIQNAGGCRTDIAAGPFTFKEAYELLPFANTYVTLEMTGLEIALVLNQAVDNIAASSGSYPYSAGLRYDVDMNLPPGARVKNIDMNPRLSSTWTALDPGRIYQVVTNSFVAGGRDGYFAFADVSEELVVDTFTEYATGFINYCKEQGVIRDPPLETYSTKSFLGLGEETTPVGSPATVPAVKCERRSRV